MPHGCRGPPVKLHAGFWLSWGPAVQLRPTRTPRHPRLFKVWPYLTSSELRKWQFHPNASTTSCNMDYTLYLFSLGIIYVTSLNALLACYRYWPVMFDRNTFKIFVCLELYCLGFKSVKYLNIFVLVLRASFCRKCCAPFIRHLSCPCLPWNGLTMLECHCHFWSSESQCQPCFPQVWTVDYLCLRHSLESSIMTYLGLSVPARA